MANKPSGTGVLTRCFDAERGGLDVNIQSSTNTLFQYLLMNEQKTDITLTAPIAVDDTVINVSAGHGFVGNPTTTPGEFMVGRNGNAYFQLRVKSVTADAITLESPADIAYPIAGTSIIRGNVQMNVDGSVTPVSYKYSFNNDSNATIPIDISAIIISIQSGASVPDDGKFGGITALANGLLLRKVNGDNVGLGNYTSNQEFRNVGGVIEYTQKAPSGTYATNIVIDIEGSFGQVLRVDPRESDYLVAQVRDVLTAAAGTDAFTISILGSFTRGE